MSQSKDQEQFNNNYYNNSPVKAILNNKMKKEIQNISLWPITATTTAKSTIYNGCCFPNQVKDSYLTPEKIKCENNTKPNLFDFNKMSININAIESKIPICIESKITTLIDSENPLNNNHNSSNSPRKNIPIITLSMKGNKTITTTTQKKPISLKKDQAITSKNPTTCMGKVEAFNPIVKSCNDNQIVTNRSSSNKPKKDITNMTLSPKKHKTQYQYTKEDCTTSTAIKPLTNPKKLISPGSNTENLKLRLIEKYNANPSKSKPQCNSTTTATNPTLPIPNKINNQVITKLENGLPKLNLSPIKGIKQSKSDKNLFERQFSPLPDTNNINKDSQCDSPLFKSPIFDYRNHKNYLHNTLKKPSKRAKTNSSRMARPKGFITERSINNTRQNLIIRSPNPFTSGNNNNNNQSKSHQNTFFPKHEYTSNTNSSLYPFYLSFDEDNEECNINGNHKDNDDNSINYVVDNYMQKSLLDETKFDPDNQQSPNNGILLNTPEPELKSISSSPSLLIESPYLEPSTKNLSLNFSPMSTNPSSILHLNKKLILLNKKLKNQTNGSSSFLNKKPGIINDQAWDINNKQNEIDKKLGELNLSKLATTIDGSNQLENSETIRSFLRRETILLDSPNITKNKKLVDDIKSLDNLIQNEIDSIDQEISKDIPKLKLLDEKLLNKDLILPLRIEVMTPTLFNYDMTSASPASFRNINSIKNIEKKPLFIELDNLETRLKNLNDRIDKNMKNIIKSPVKNLISPQLSLYI